MPSGIVNPLSFFLGDQEFSINQEDGLVSEFILDIPFNSIKVGHHIHIDVV